ncbi:MAG: hypothetical protein WBM50_03725, partial [Acidimicrobiales bacterium]
MPHRPIPSDEPTAERLAPRREGLAMMAAALFGAVVVLGLLVGLQRWRSGDETAVAAEIEDGSGGTARSDEALGSEQADRSPQTTLAPDPDPGPGTDGSPDAGPSQGPSATD